MDLHVYDVDRTLAERARDVVWNYGVKPKDAIHVATALDAQVDQLDTFDEGLLKEVAGHRQPSARYRSPVPVRARKPDDGMG